MEQTRYWMWARSKVSERTSHVHATTATYNASWEEQAFAEDSAGLLGGCIWPPRSYSCSFCRREFRSAQALGGHMNVHRRDRARLKQSSPTPNQNEILDQPNHQNDHHLPHQHPSLVGIENPSQLCSFVYNTGDLNSNPSFLSSSPLSPSRVTISSSTHDISIKKPPTYNSSNIVHHENQKGPLLSTPRSDSLAARLLIITDSKLGKEKELKATETGLIRGKEEYVKPNSALSLNLVLPERSRTTGSSSDDEESISRKRRRSDEPSYLPFFLKPILDDRLRLEPNELGVLNQSCEEEELDLELRLGDQPKVKYNCRTHMLN